MDTKEWLQLSQVLVTLGGFLFAILQLRSEYRWRRKQYAVNMLGDWNGRVVVHRMSIEASFPGLKESMNEQRFREAVEELAKRAEEIYLSGPKKREEDHLETDWELREHIIELLNYCEYVASSHEMGVGDPEMLENSFGAPLIRWYDVLQPFIRVVVKHRGFNPWEPFERFAGLLQRAHGARVG